MTTTTSSSRATYIAAALVATGIFVLYLVTLAPTVALWDAGEYIAAAYTFGTPHPPGNPLFVLLGRTFTLLPVAPEPAQRLNVLAALGSALAAGVWFLITERATRAMFAQRWQRILVGTLGALVGATSFTVWNQSVVSEKVYTITLAIFAAIAWLMVRWAEDPDGRGADRRLVLVAYLIGLGYANHMGGVLAGPAVAVAVLAIRPRTVLRWRLLLTGAAALVLGVTPFVIQPIRAAHFPEINMGETTGCLTEFQADCVLSDRTMELWKQHIDRSQYPKPGYLDRQVPFVHQVGMWWMYFKWQWLRDLHGNSPGLQTALAAMFLILGLYGAREHWMAHRRSFWFFAPFVFTVTLLFVFLLNFKLGWTQARIGGLDPSLPSEVRDRDYFYVWGFSAWGVWVALGLAGIWRALGERLAGSATEARTAMRPWLVTVPVMAIALLPLVLNADDAPRTKDTVARDWAIDLLNSVEPYGVLITGGDNDTYPLWYAQEVEGVRRDVTVAVTSLLNTDWYVRQMVRRPVYDYDAANGPAIYRDREWPKPAGPPINVPLAAVESLPPYMVLREPAQLRKDSLVATIPPGPLTRDQLVVLSIIKDSFPNRPLYLARSAGGYGESLGLEPYLITHGLARKVLPGPVRPGPGIVQLQGEGWIDATRSAALWDVYRGTTALKNLDDWMDRASANIPYLYLSTGVLTAEGLQRIGMTAKADSIYEDARLIVQETRLEKAFGLAGQ